MTRTFRKVAEAMRSTGDSMDILGKAGRTNITDAPSPAGLYVWNGVTPTRDPAPGSNWTRRRKRQRMARRVLHLLHWLHNWGPCGSHENSAPKTPKSLIAVCKREPPGDYNAGVAITLMNANDICPGIPGGIVLSGRISLGVDPLVSQSICFIAR